MVVFLERYTTIKSSNIHCDVSSFRDDGTLEEGGIWSFDDNKKMLDIKIGEEVIKNLIIFAGHDWENQKETILFTGLDSKGCSVWGKRIK